MPPARGTEPCRLSFDSFEWYSWKSAMLRVGRIEQRRQFVAQHIDLFVRQQPDAGDIALALVALQLLVAEGILSPAVGRVGQGKHRGDRSVVVG